MRYEKFLWTRHTMSWPNTSTTMQMRGSATQSMVSPTYYVIYRYTIMTQNQRVPNDENVLLHIFLAVVLFPLWFPAAIDKAIVQMKSCGDS